MLHFLWRYATSLAPLTILQVLIWCAVIQTKKKKNHLAIIDPIFVFLAGGSFGETLDWSCLFMVLCLQHNSDFLK